jgi:hypothetical protein
MDVEWHLECVCLAGRVVWADLWFWTIMYCTLQELMALRLVNLSAKSKSIERGRGGAIDIFSLKSL